MTLHFLFSLIRLNGLLCELDLYVASSFPFEKDVQISHADDVFLMGSFLKRVIFMVGWNVIFLQYLFSDINFLDLDVDWAIDKIRWNIDAAKMFGIIEQYWLWNGNVNFAMKTIWNYKSNQRDYLSLWTFLFLGKHK